MASSDIITKDFGWKFFSLLLAVAIWVTVSIVSKDSSRGGDPLAQTKMRSFTNLPIAVVSSTADVREFKIQPGVVGVVVSGRPEVVNALTEKEIHATVDLTDVETAIDRRKRVDVSTPPGVTLVEATPSLVEVIAPAKPKP